MPEIGEITKGSTIGKKPDGLYYQYLQCPQCFTPRWMSKSSISIAHAQPFVSKRLCKDCNTKAQGRSFKVGVARDRSNR